MAKCHPNDPKEVFVESNRAVQTTQAQPTIHWALVRLSDVRDTNMEKDHEKEQIQPWLHIGEGFQNELRPPTP